jgi:hypothetical protein
MHIRRQLRTRVHSTKALHKLIYTPSHTSVAHECIHDKRYLSVDNQRSRPQLRGSLAQSCGDLPILRCYVICCTNDAACSRCHRMVPCDVVTLLFLLVFSLLDFLFSSSVTSCTLRLLLYSTYSQTSSHLFLCTLIYMRAYCMRAHAQT